MQLSEDGIRLLKRFEGLRLQIYRDIAGKETIGIGHLLTPREKKEHTFESGLTDESAHDLLMTDAETALSAIRRSIVVSLAPHEVDVLCSFVFNEGGAALATSTLAACLNRGEREKVPSELLRWDKFTDPTTGKLTRHPGLALRRTAEGRIWLYGYDAPASEIAVRAAAKALEELRLAADQAYALQIDLRDIAIPMDAHGAYSEAPTPPPKKDSID